ncbi:hypothetical protein [[Eubacterium] cellulosolvens]
MVELRKYIMVSKKLRKTEKVWKKMQAQRSKKKKKERFVDTIPPTRPRDYSSEYPSDAYQPYDRDYDPSPRSTMAAQHRARKVNIDYEDWDSIETSYSNRGQEYYSDYDAGHSSSRSARVRHDRGVGRSRPKSKPGQRTRSGSRTRRTRAEEDDWDGVEWD